MSSVTWQFSLGMHLFRQAERDTLAVPSSRVRRNELVCAKALGHLPFKVERKKSPMRRSVGFKKSEDLVKDLQALPFAVPTVRRVEAVRRLKAASVAPAYKAGSPMIAGFFIPTISKCKKLSKSKKKKFFGDLRTLLRRREAGLLPWKQQAIQTLLERIKHYSFRKDGSLAVERVIRKRRLQEHTEVVRAPHKVTYSRARFRKEVRVTFKFPSRAKWMVAAKGRVPVPDSPVNPFRLWENPVQRYLPGWD